LISTSQTVANLAEKIPASVAVAEPAIVENNPPKFGSTKMPTADGYAKPDRALATAAPVAEPHLVSAPQPATNPAGKIVAPATSAEVVVFEKNMPKPELLKISIADPLMTTGEPAADPSPAPVSHPAAMPAEKALNFDPALSLKKAVEIGGTGVASIPLQMKNPQKTNKVAGPDVKVLPMGENAQAHMKNLPPQLVVSPVRTAENRGTDLSFSFANGNNQTPVTENAPVLNVLDLPSLSDARLRALDRTHDMMALHAMRLVESKSDTLSVVIKPAAGTELSLELRQHADGIEAQATVTRGDHQFLSQHWPELQQRLEQRGIKLAPLGGETNLSANDNGHFQQNQTSQEDVVQQAAAFAEFAAAGTTGGATARVAAVHDGWESWA